MGLCTQANLCSRNGWASCALSAAPGSSRGQPCASSRGRHAKPSWPPTTCCTRVPAGWVTRHGSPCSITFPYCDADLENAVSADPRWDLKSDAKREARPGRATQKATHPAHAKTRKNSQPSPASVDGLPRYADRGDSSRVSANSYRRRGQEANKCQKHREKPTFSAGRCGIRCKLRECRN